MYIINASDALKAANEINSQDNLTEDMNNIYNQINFRIDIGEYRAGVEVSANSVREVIDWLTNKGYKINLPTKTNPNKQFIWIYWGTDDQVTPLDSICGF